MANGELNTCSFSDALRMIYAFYILSSRRRRDANAKIVILHSETRLCHNHERMILSSDLYFCLSLLSYILMGASSCEKAKNRFTLGTPVESYLRVGRCNVCLLNILQSERRNCRTCIKQVCVNISDSELFRR